MPSNFNCSDLHHQTRQNFFALHIVEIKRKSYRFTLEARLPKVVPSERNTCNVTEYTGETALKMSFSFQVTVEKVVLSYMERIKEVNPLVNAVVEDRFEEALLEAKLLDKELGERDADAFRTKPLLGVPFTVKESLSVQGLPRRAGSLLFDDVRCLKDAEVVSLLRRSGAIPLLVSNTPELCMNWETTNNVTGRTNNPYDVRRTCGGSSGGEVCSIIYFFFHNFI